MSKNPKGLFKIFSFLHKCDCYYVYFEMRYVPDLVNFFETTSCYLAKLIEFLPNLGCPPPLFLPKIEF